MTYQKINLSKLNAHCINNIVHCPLNKQITKISSDKQYVKHESFALHEIVHIIVSTYEMKIVGQFYCINVSPIWQGVPGSWKYLDFVF